MRVFWLLVASLLVVGIAACRGVPVLPADKQFFLNGGFSQDLEKAGLKCGLSNRLEDIYSTGYACTKEEAKQRAMAKIRERCKETHGECSQDDCPDGICSMVVSPWIGSKVSYHDVDLDDCDSGYGYMALFSGSVHCECVCDIPD